MSLTHRKQASAASTATLPPRKHTHGCKTGNSLVPTELQNPEQLDAKHAQVRAPADVHQGYQAHKLQHARGEWTTTRYTVSCDKRKRWTLAVDACAIAQCTTSRAVTGRPRCTRQTCRAKDEEAFPVASTTRPSTLRLPPLECALLTGKMSSQYKTSMDMAVHNTAAPLYTKCAQWRRQYQPAAHKPPQAHTKYAQSRKEKPGRTVSAARE
jgi:hypothetical protein